MTEICFEIEECAGESDQPSSAEQSILIRAYVMFLLTWQTLFRVSDIGFNILLQFFSLVLKFLAAGLQITSLNAFIQCLPLNAKAAKVFWL